MNVLASSEIGVVLEIFRNAFMIAFVTGASRETFPLLIASINEVVVTTPMILCSSFTIGN